MSDPIPAIYDSGVFRPLVPVNWPNGTRAEVVLSTAAGTSVPQTPAPATTWPPGYFEQTAGALAGEVFERPPQGDLPQREPW